MPALRLQPRLLAYIELARLSNAPTVVSNALTGCAIGAAGRAEGAYPWPTAAAIGLAAVFLYTAGMALNDAADARTDAAERPSRPIPSGRVSRPAALAFAVLCMAGALAIAAAFGPAALAFALTLAACIVAYDLLHLRSRWTVLLMALCRALVPLTAAAAVAWPFGMRAGLAVAVLLGAYTAAFTLIARAEAARDAATDRRLPLVLLTTPLLALAVVPAQTPRAALLALVPGVLLIWRLLKAAAFIRRPPRPRIGPAVLAWIAAIPLLDALLLVLMDRSLPSLAALACFALTLLLHRRIPGT